MRILIVSQNYAPEPTSVGPYTTGLAEHFAKAGHETIVATTFPHYPQWRWQDGTRHLRLVETINDVQVRRWRVILPRRPGSTPSRLVFDLSVGLGMLLNSLGVPIPDVIICVSPPIETSFVGILFARMWQRPFLILVKDMPVDVALAVGMLKSGRIARAGLAFEGALYRRATRVVTISDGFSGPLRDLGVPAAAIKQISDWIDTDALRPLQPSESMRAQLGARDGDFLVIHAGNMGEKQALRHVVEAAGVLTNDSKVQIALVGDGPQVSRLESEIARLGLVHIRILPLIPKNEVATMLSSANVLLVSQRTKVVGSVLPSKMLSYMASGRPIIAAVAESSATANLIREAKCGIVVAPEDAQALADGIEIMQGDPVMCRRMGENGRRHAIEKFSKAGVLRQWDALLAEVVPKVEIITP